MSKSKAGDTLRELMEMFVLGRDMPAQRWEECLHDDKAFSGMARQLVWQSDGRRFILDGETCHARDGSAFIPEGAVGLAHPVELDADEILYWREKLAETGIKQPFRQMWEPVVLIDGKLPGRTRRVQSAGESYKMLDRYPHYRLPLTAITKLKEDGFRFITRRRWDRNKWRMAEIEVVNIVTPAGIFYECMPDVRMEQLSAQSDAHLILNLFYPFEGVRLRTLNHFAAALEGCLIPEIIERDALDMLLPHLPGVPSECLKELLQSCDGDSKIAALLGKLLERKWAVSC